VWWKWGQAKEADSIIRTPSISISIKYFNLELPAFMVFVFFLDIDSIALIAPNFDREKAESIFRKDIARLDPYVES
jgi:hypothetical protein